MLRPNEFRVCRNRGKSSMYTTLMGHWLTQSSRTLVLKARQAGENRAYSLSMLTRLRLDAPLARRAADRVCLDHRHQFTQGLAVVFAQPRFQSSRFRLRYSQAAHQLCFGEDWGLSLESILRPAISLRRVPEHVSRLGSDAA